MMGVLRRPTDPMCSAIFQSTDFFALSSVWDCVGQMNTTSATADLCSHYKQQPYITS